jgi:hypothetical protein
MKLWDSVCETDKAITKHVNQRGGFTAICAQAQLKRATQEWGSYGGKWGVKECNYILIQGESGIAEIALDAVFYYPDGEFEISADASYKAGNDSRKKLLTDVTTKALSKLGFNSDVFEGKFDDNKYVDEMRKKFDKQITQKPKEDTPAEHKVKEKAAVDWVLKQQEAIEVLETRDEVINFSTIHTQMVTRVQKYPKAEKLLNDLLGDRLGELS